MKDCEAYLHYHNIHAAKKLYTQAALFKKGRKLTSTQSVNCLSALFIKFNIYAERALNSSKLGTREYQIPEKTGFFFV